MKKYFLLTCFSLLLLHAEAQQSFLLSFASGQQTFLLPQNVAENFTGSNRDQFSGKAIRLLHFKEIPDAAERSQMAASGIELLAFAGEKTYVASIDLNVFNDQKIPALADGSFAFAASGKMHEELWKAMHENVFPPYATRDNQAGITFTYHRTLNHEEVLKAATEAGCELVYHNANSHRVTVWIDRSRLETFLDLPFVAAAELKDDVPHPDNNTGRTDHRVNWMAEDFPGGRHYNGSGVSIMLQDDGFLGPHIDYTGRLLQQYYTVNTGDHGDHCAGILMGGGNKDPLTRGMGWGANLYEYEAIPYQGFDSIYTHYNTNNIVISSTSYSDGCNAGYTTLAQTLDQQIIDMPHLIHVFSAGNNGTLDCSYGAGAGWGNITGGHKASKNCIAVGNLDEMDNVAASSSRGPVHDGRLKPEVCAVGTGVYSTIDPNSYGVKSGTSMACPAVAGTLSTMYQAWRELHGNSDPYSGMMKAVLMNTADDLGNAGPDFIYGYGRINARKAITCLEQNYLLMDSIGNGNTQTHTISVPAGTGKLKVLVYWHDVPALASAAVALVNDIDMTVSDPSNTSYQPWVLDYTPNAASLSNPAVRGNDNRNNHEQVTIDNPAAGNYTVTINGTNIPSGPQRYFICWYFEPVNELVLTYPNGGEGFAPSENFMIRWDAVGNNGTFSLEYTTDNGLNWNPISSGIAATDRAYNWMIPVVASGQCKVRITRGNVSDESNQNFSIINIPSNLNVVWACQDSLKLNWMPVSNATAYDIYMLGAAYMDSIGTTTIDSFTVHNLNNATNTYWFSVRARGAQNAVSRRAIAIEKQPYVYCPVAIDAGIDTLYNPQGTVLNCGVNTTLPVTAVIHNFGLTTISGVPVSFSVNGGPAVTETYPGTIAPFTTMIYTFTNQASFPNTGQNTVAVWSSYSNDGVVMNDTAYSTVTVSSSTPVTTPWLEDFESFALCSTVTDCGVTVCPMSNGFANLLNGREDDIDWRTSEGSTPSGGTGPDSDYNPGTLTGNYLYLEASGGCNQQTAILYSPCLDLSGLSMPVLNFAYHMYGTSMGSLHADVFSNGVWNNDAFVMSGDQGNQWFYAQASLSAYQNQIISIRFRGITGTDYDSDMAIDAVAINDAVGIHALANASSATVSPNPSSGIFDVRWINTNANEVSLRVYDLAGRLMLTQHEKSAAQLSRLDLSVYENGSYILVLKLDEAEQTFRITKTN